MGSDSSADIRNNTFSNIGGYGVALSWHTLNNKIFGNIILNTSYAGICLSDTAGSAGYYGGASISNNTILNSKQQGILLTARNKGVIITRNTIFNCSGYAIEFNANSDNNEVKWNNFIHNNGGNTQACDNGKNNLFEYNHWDDHFDPDTNSDGIVDTVYNITSRGLKLNGNSGSYMRTNNVSTFASTELTLELWVKPYDTTKGFIVSYASTNSTNDLLFGWYTTSGYLDIYVGSSSINTGIAIDTGEWTHLAVTWQSSDGNTSFWVNSTLEFSGNISKGEMFGKKQICKIIQHNAKGNADEILAAVIDALKNHTSDQKPEDDATMVIVKDVGHT